MRAKFIKLLLVLAVLSLIFVESKVFAQEEESSSISIPVGISYSSAYFWRGTEIDGGEGVFWPSIGLEFAGLSLGVTAGIDAAYFTDENSDSKDSNKQLTEVDYSLGYSLPLGDLVSIDLGVLYAQYPFYDETDSSNVDPSFIEGSIAIGLNTILSPAFEAYYDYFVQDDTDDAKVDEDYYLKFSLGQDLISTDNLTCSLGAWIGYYNNAYADAKGWSDAGLSLGVSQSYKDVSFDSAFNYARSLSEDFQGLDKKFKNHFWVDFGVSTSI